MRNIAAVFLIFYASLLHAAGASGQIESQMGGKVLRSGPSIAAGYKAILAEKGGKTRVFHESPDGRYLFYGLVFDQSGNNITAADASALISGAAVAPNPGVQDSAQPYGSPAAALRAAASSSYIKEGSGPVVYVVFDPNCPYCKQLYAETRQYVGKTETRWIPVGVVSESSAEIAAAMLTSGKQSLLWMGTGKFRRETPGEAMIKKLDRNITVLAESGSGSVPTIIFMSDGKPVVISGMPEKTTVARIFSGK